MEDVNANDDVRRNWRLQFAENIKNDHDLARIGNYAGVIIGTFATLEMTEHDNLTGLLAIPSVALIVKGIRLFNRKRTNDGLLKESEAKMSILTRNAQS